MNDAKRNAVQKVIGTYIDSCTLASEAVIVLDEIYAKSYGIVKGIDLLEEGPVGDSYRVKARMDVDTSPNSELLDKIFMIESLNGSRMSVIVTYGGSHGNDDMATYCESTIVEMLLGQGFHYVIDPDAVRGDIGAASNQRWIIWWLVN